MTGTKPRTFTLACVVDDHPRFLMELVLWAHCVHRHLPRERFAPLVYFVGREHPELASWLAEKNIPVRRTEAVVPGSPHCNKIAPLTEDHETDAVIVTDSDLFFVRDPADLFQSQNIRAAPNNHCVPPDHIFRAILGASGLGRPYRPGMALYRGRDGLRETHLNNISAGIVGLPRTKAKDFAGCWKRWAEWLTANRHLLAQWGGHVDQVSFTLATEDLGEDIEFLPPQVNTILHSLEEIASVYAFHLTPAHIPSFAHLFQPDRTMLNLGFRPGVAEAVERLNDCIEPAVEDILTFAETRDHLEFFLNPRWIR